MTDTTARSRTAITIPCWLLAGGLVAIPLLQHSPIDFERTATALAFGPAVVAGRRLIRTEAHLWLAHRGLRWLGLLGALWTLIAILTADQFAPAVVQSAHNAVLLGVALLSAALIRFRAALGRPLLLAIAAGAGVGVLALLGTWYSMADPHHAPAGELTRMYPHIRHIGLHLLAASAVLPVLAGTAKGTAQRLALLALASVISAALVWSGGRAPLLGLGVAVVFAIALLPRERRGAVAFAFAAVALASFALSTLYWNTHSHLGWWRAWQATTGRADLNAVSSLRLETWKICAQHLQAHPWFGIGPDGYRFIHPRLGGQQPHNVAIQWALSAGIPFALLGTAALLALLRAIWIRVKSQLAAPGNTGNESNAFDSAFIAAATATMAVTIAALLDGGYYHVLSTTSLAIGLGLLIGPVVTLAATLPPPRFTLGWRWAGRLGVATIILALSVHAWLFHALARATPPPTPDAPVVRVLRAFPSTTFGLERWLDTWAEDDPREALAWARWAGQHSAYRWYLHLWSAKLLLRLGEPAAARAEWLNYNRLRMNAQLQHKDSAPADVEESPSTP